jgi:hypothetical protein
MEVKMPKPKPQEDPKKTLEEEFQRRYKTRNLFKPDAGPPDAISALQKKAMELRRLGREATVPRRIIRSVPTRGNGANGRGYAHKPAPLVEPEVEEQRVPDFDVPETPKIVRPEEPEVIDGGFDLKLGIQEDAPEIERPEDLEERVEQQPVLPMSSPYNKGDDIYLEILDYFECNKLGKKKIKIIGGKSRTGKSMIMDRVFALTTTYDMAGSSEKGLVDMIEEINVLGAMYIHEFQETLAKNEF